MASMKKMTKRGFTLIELMIVVVIIGILAALAIYGVNQYVTNAKTAEARTAVGRMGKDALVAFEGEQMAGGVMALGTTRGISRRLCGYATALVPATMAGEGEKWQPTATAFQLGDTDNGFRCLKYSMDQPILFQYGFNSNSGGAVAANTHIALAFGQATLGGQTVAIGQNMSVQGTAPNIMLTLAPALSEGNTALTASNSVTPM